MSTTEIARFDPDDIVLPDAESARSALDHYLGTGDLGRLEPAQRAALYLEVCRSLSINARTRPLDWIEFYDPETKAKKLTLYPNKSCTDQLAYLHKIRVRLVEEKTVGTLFKVVLEGTMPDGRQETNVAYLDLTDAQGQPLRGQRYGNALMKCHTKAKRRLVLGMVGMSVPDDESLPRARRVYVDAGGNVIERPTAEQRYLAEHPRVAGVIGEPTLEDTSSGVETGFEGEPDLPVRSDSGPRRAGQRPSFKPSEDDTKRWLGAWHAEVTGTSYADDDMRHKFFREWTSEYPDALRTASSRAFFSHCTREQAGELLAHIRAVVADEKRERRLADTTNDADELDDEERPF